MKINKNLIFGSVMTCIILYFLNPYISYFPWTWILLIRIGIFILCYPWTGDDGNIYSLFGGFSENDIYSLFGIIQVTKGSACSIFGIALFQKGEKTYQVGGIVVYQQAKVESGQIFGIVLWRDSPSQDSAFTSIEVFSK